MRHIAVLALGHIPAVMPLGVNWPPAPLLVQNVFVGYMLTATLDPQVGFSSNSRF